MAVGTNGAHIGRDDLRAAFQRAIGEGQRSAKASLPSILVLAIAGAAGIAAVAFGLGRRGGRKDSAIVEIRRL
ncbi:MAG: hypothetical protein ACRDVP_12480 [Acidimicrobiales bacterium]